MYEIDMRLSYLEASISTLLRKEIDSEWTLSIIGRAIERWKDILHLQKDVSSLWGVSDENRFIIMQIKDKLDEAVSSGELRQCDLYHGVFWETIDGFDKMPIQMKQEDLYFGWNTPKSAKIIRKQLVISTRLSNPLTHILQEIEIERKGF